MTFIVKFLAVIAFIILPIGLLMVFGYFIWRRIFKKHVAYKAPFGKTGIDGSPDEAEFWYGSSGFSTDDNSSGGGAFGRGGASGDFDNSGGDN